VHHTIMARPAFARPMGYPMDRLLVKLRVATTAKGTATMPDDADSAARREELKKNAEDVVERAAGLSEEVLKSVEAGQRAAIDAVRKFVDSVDEALPAHGERAERRESVVEAAFDMADKLVTSQYEFLRNVVRSADRAIRKTDQPDAQK